MKLKKGFTLAEVLIALTLIGVISTLAIPSLISSTDKNKKIAAAKKAYNVASSAYVKSVAENSDIRNLKDLTNEMVKHMNVKYYIQENNKAKTNVPVPDDTTNDKGETTAATKSNWIVTEDGIGYRIQKSDEFTSGVVCNKDKITFTTKEISASRYCYFVMIDIDGPTKGDNINATVTTEDNGNGGIKIKGISGDRFYTYITKQGLTAGNANWTTTTEVYKAMAKIMESDD